MQKQDVKIKIRHMEIDDLAPAFHLGEKLFTLKSHPNLYRTWDEYEIIDFYHASSDYCFSAFVNEKFAGFLLGTVIEKSRHRKYGYLVWTGVSSEYRGLGIGSKLFDKFKDMMEEEEVNMIIVDTQADNEKAIKFFKEKGFGNQQDHVYFTMTLKEATNHEAELPKKRIKL